MLMVHIHIKVAMILGVSGACRREELYNITMKDVEDRGELIFVKIPQTKTNIERTFTFVNQDEKIHYLDIFRRYIQLRPSNAKSERLFLAFHNGKCRNQVVGKGTIGRWPSKIAEYLKLSNPASYTGHSFRRTSATLLANKGVDILGLKRHGGWKSSSVAESYVEDSLQNKIQFAEKILYDVRDTSVSIPDGAQQVSSDTISYAAVSTNTRNSEINSLPLYIHNCSIHNCTFNFNSNK